MHGRRAGPGKTRRRPIRGPRPQPKDLLHRYLTPLEVFGTGPVEQHLGWIQHADQELVLREIAFWLSKFDESGLAGWKAIERNWVDEYLVDPLRARILGMLQGDRTLVTTQSLMIAAKRAITSGGPSAERDMRPLFMAALSIQGGLGSHRVADETREARHLRLMAELISNAQFHRRPERGTRVAQSQVRWRDIPGIEGANLPVVPMEAFEEVTGIPLLDLQAVGFFLYSQSIERPGGVPTVGGIADVIHWQRERLDRVLGPIAAPIEVVAAIIRRDEEAYGEDWTFDAMRQFPVLRLSDDRILILSQHLVLERTLGWLPFLDMTQPVEATVVTRATARRAKTAFEMTCEREVLQTLRVNVASGRRRGRLFDGATLRATYPRGQIADAAIAYRDEWVIVEVSSGQLRRGTVIGGLASTLAQDLERLIDEKVDQIEDTIAHIRAEPGRLSGDERPRRRFVPVLINAEGVPINPLTHTTIADRVAAAGRLADADVEPLHVLDTEDLYVAEAIVERHRLGLNELLRQHRRAGLMRRVDLKDWLAMEGRTEIARPERLQPSLDAALALITETLGMAGPDGEEAGGEPH
jgi:hypothetical protein